MNIQRNERCRHGLLRGWGPSVFLGCWLVAGTSAPAAAEESPPSQWLSVAVLEGKVYPRPDRTTLPLALLPYATRVEALERAGPPDLLQRWVRVRPNGSEAPPETSQPVETDTANETPVHGWMLSTVLDARELVEDLEGDREAIRRVAKQAQALAGRSFEDEVERRLAEGAEELAEARRQLADALAARPPLETADLEDFRHEGALPPLDDSPTEAPR